VTGDRGPPWRRCVAKDNANAKRRAETRDRSTSPTGDRGPPWRRCVANGQENVSSSGHHDSCGEDDKEGLFLHALSPGGSPGRLPI
jgi:hypothetical protein